MERDVVKNSSRLKLGILTSHIARSGFVLIWRKMGERAWLAIHQ